MPALKNEIIPYLENMIYLPMILTILEKDRVLIQNGDFKLKKPYLGLLDSVATCVHKELGNTAAYLRKKQVSVMRGRMDDIFTEYIFLHDHQEERRRYLNVRLRNRTEELLTQYLQKPGI